MKFDTPKMKKTYTRSQALQKAMDYCAIQERCYNDVRKKLYQWGVYSNDVEEIICQLIGENFLDEERYAIAFARGHLCIKKWGKQKIAYELKAKQISTPCIKKAIDEIDESIYKEILKALAQKKLKEHKDLPKNHIQKTVAFLSAKGFEYEIIKEVLSELCE